MSVALSTSVAAAAAAPGGIDPLTIGFVVLIVILVLFMFRNSRKRRRDAEALKSKMVPGAEVMTQHGIYGTLLSIDEDKNEALIETTPGTVLRVHRQVLSRVVEPIEADDEAIHDEPDDHEELDQVADTTPEGEPEYGERITEDKPKNASGDKAAD
jgi:preprotein translocase subunit YajC